MSHGLLVLEGEGKAQRWTMDDVKPHIVIQLKRMFPAIPKAQAPPFTFRADLRTAADLDWFLHRYPMEMAGADRAFLHASVKRFESKSREVENLFNAEDYTPTLIQAFKEGKAARPYQALVGEMLARSYGLLCGDEVGLGKTIEGIVAMMIPGALPAMVVCDPHLQRQWVEKLAEFTHLKVHAIKKTKPYKLPGADVYVMRYTQLVGWADAYDEMGLKLVVYDEIGELRTGIGDDPSKPIQKGVGAHRLSNACTYRLGLSATPIYNYGIEMWNVMSYLRPETLGPKDDFRSEWCYGSRVQDPKALGTFLREQHAFIRRTKKDVGQEMDPVNLIPKAISYDEKTMADAEKLAHELAIKSTTGLWNQRGQAARELDLRLRQQTGIAKAKGIASFVRMIVEGGAPVIVGLWHREVYAIIMKALEDLKPVMYSGSESDSQKDRSKKSFCNGDTDVMLLSIRSGKGLDGLQHRCSTGVIGEFDWSPAVHHQFFGRLDRDGQKDPVTGFYLYAEEGSDPPMMEVLGLKAAEAANIIDPGLGVQAAHTDESHLQRLVERYLNRKGS